MALQAAWDHFLLVWNALFFVPMGLLLADLFYRQVVQKRVEMKMLRPAVSANRG